MSIATDQPPTALISAWTASGIRERLRATHYEAFCQGWEAALGAAHTGRWRTIESAPRDGTEVLLGGTYPNGNPWVEISMWFVDHWYSHRLNPPTHWQPLPAPPADAREHSSPRQVLQPIRDELLLSKGGGESPSREPSPSIRGVVRG